MRLPFLLFLLIALIGLTVLPAVLFGLFWFVGLHYGGIAVHVVWLSALFVVSAPFYFYMRKREKRHDDRSGTILLSEKEIREIVADYEKKMMRKREAA